MQNESENKCVLAVFDFDGTITKVDTFNDFIRWNFGCVGLFKVILLAAPLIILYKLGAVSNDIPKRFMFKYYFKGIDNHVFDERCLKYVNTRLDHIIKKSALERIKWHATKGHTLIINSASLSNWIAPWGIKNGFKDILATDVEIEQGILTGNFSTKCCYGSEKLRRLVAAYPKSTYKELYAYGDSRGDRELLSVADYPFFKVFRG